MHDEVLDLLYEPSDVRQPAIAVQRFSMDYENGVVVEQFLARVRCRKIEVELQLSSGSILPRLVEQLQSLIESRKACAVDQVEIS